MSIFARVSDIFKANVNEILDRMEDPEKMVKQMIIEMEEALVKATSALAKAMANERNLRKQQENALSQAKQWEEKAAMALKAGNADLAKQALSKKIIADGQAKQYDAMVGQASSVTSQRRSQLDTLKTRLEQLKAQLQESLPPEASQAYQQGIDEVTQSGIVDKARKTGDQAPLFELPNASGQPVKLEELLKQGPVVRENKRHATLLQGGPHARP